MSLKAMVWVLENSEAKLGDRLVLLTLAEHAGDDGEDAYPSQETLARKARLSERQVRRCLANLERDGLIVRDGTTRYGTVRWQVNMTPDNMTARTSTTETPDRMSPEPSLEPSSVSVEGPGLSLVRQSEDLHVPRAREKPQRWKVDRKQVTPHEDDFAEAVLDFWNEVTGQSLTSRDWLAKIVMRIREHPELDRNAHRHAIQVALREPWWDGHPSPSVVYGNGACFERALTAARNGPAPRKEARRFGRGVGPGELRSLASDLRSAGR